MAAGKNNIPQKNRLKSDLENNNVATLLGILNFHNALIAGHAAHVAFIDDMAFPVFQAIFNAWSDISACILKRRAITSYSNSCFPSLFHRRGRIYFSGRRLFGFHSPTLKPASADIGRDIAIAQRTAASTDSFFIPFISFSVKVTHF